MSKRAVIPNRIRFDVADVTPSTEALPCVELGVALTRTIKTKLLVCHESTSPVISEVDFHPLIAAAAFAFKQHYPLVLSPDMIWLTILQGVAQHIQNNAKNLKARLVPHQTKIELVVETGLESLPKDNEQMLALAKGFSNQSGV